MLLYPPRVTDAPRDRPDDDEDGPPDPFDDADDDDRPMGPEWRVRMDRDDQPDPSRADGLPDAARATPRTPPAPAPAPDALRARALPDPAVGGPLTRDVAIGYLDRAAELMASADFADAFRLYRRVVGFDDAAVTAAALLGAGEALHRLDRDDDAVATWSQILQLPETPATYAAWRNIAAARVRDGDLAGAITAYREADRRAPEADKPEIASRLGWLAKETGDPRGASRYFARARGDAGVALSMILIGLTAVVSLTAAFSPDGEFIYRALQLDKVALAAGEAWRLLTVTLVHAPGFPLHLLFNMYALWLAGPLVEQLYGRWMFLVFYVLFAIGGSVASFAFSDGRLAVGASGAIFGLFGLLLAAARVHHPVVDRQGRMFLGQIGGLILVNLLIGFALGGSIDNGAHVGGLVAGLWLGFLIPPGRVKTLRTMWSRPAGSTGPSTAELAARVLGVLALLALFVALYALGVGKWS